MYMAIPTLLAVGSPRPSLTLIGCLCVFLLWPQGGGTPNGIGSHVPVLVSSHRGGPRLERMGRRGLQQRRNDLVVLDAVGTSDQVEHVSGNRYRFHSMLS